MNNTQSAGNSISIPGEAIQAYRRDGVVRIRGIITPDEAAKYREAALDLSQRMKNHTAGGVAEMIFTQLVNVWRDDERVKDLTLHPRIASAARQLAGVDLRLWHDQILIKQPNNQAPTEFHQDQPYWPHANSPDPISCWVALCDVPVERGCMTFIPGSHRRTDLEAQNLSDSRSLFTICPDLQWDARLTLPLRAGDCTFHHGRCAHMANANSTSDPRVAHAIIFMNATTTYAPRTPHGHVVTRPLNLSVGQRLDGEMFPLVG